CQLSSRAASLGSNHHPARSPKGPPMPATVASGQAPEVDTPKRPLHALTTYELTYYRGRLENALAYLDKQDPVPAIRADIQAALDKVIAEQDDRARIAAADA